MLKKDSHRTKKYKFETNDVFAKNNAIVVGKRGQRIETCCLALRRVKETQKRFLKKPLHNQNKN